MELKQFKLVNVNLDMLRKLLGISLTLAEKSDTLNIQFSSAGLTGIASNSSDSMYKKWSIDWSTISTTEQKEFDLIPKLKCSIYKGEDFSKKILSFFGGIADIIVFHNATEVKQFQIQKRGTNDKVSLKIDVLTAAANLAFTDYAEDLIEAVFSPQTETLTATMTLGVSDLQTVSSLSRLTVNPEKQTKYITLYTVDKQLKATDQCFDVVLQEETETVLPDGGVEIDKTLWSKIDKDEYIVELHTIEDSKMFVCKSQTKQVVEALALLAKTDDSINFDDFVNDDSDFTK